MVLYKTENHKNVYYVMVYCDKFPAQNGINP